MVWEITVREESYLCVEWGLNPILAPPFLLKHPFHTPPFHLNLLVPHPNFVSTVRQNSV